VNSDQTQAKGKRRGQGEDSIYRDSPKNQHVGAVSLGFNPAFRRIRRKVTGHTKAEARDKPRELHQDAATADRATPGLDALAGAVFAAARFSCGRAART
jgi:hypothetical protein